MPVSRVALVRTTILAFLVGLAALAVIVGAAVWLVERTEDYSDAIREIRRERAAYVDLRSLLQDMETGQRGFLLTDNEAYLEPYKAAEQKYPEQLAIAQARSAGDPAREAEITSLAEVIELKRRELAETIAAARSGRQAEALAQVESDRGRALMEDARSRFSALIASAEAEFASTNLLQQAAINWLRIVTIGGAIAILAVALGSLWMIVVYMRQLTDAQKEVQVLNSDLEARVRERTAELGRANDEIQRFAYIVTHDLRAPLVNVMGFTSELETSLAPIQAEIGKLDPEADPAARDAHAAAFEDLPEAISFIRSSTKKMDGLINAILKLSREGRRTLKPERLDLEPLLQAAAASVRHQIVEAGGTITIEGRVPQLVSDRLALEQIFGNLLDNAVKYSAKDRPLVLALRMRTEPGGYVAVDVEDNGRGIAPQDHERIFELFRRSGLQDQPGEGIGLAHVRTMVRNLGGDVGVASTPGQGTTFTVSIAQDLRRISKGPTT